MTPLHYFMIAILGASLVIINNTVYADSITSPDSFLKKCNDNTSQIPTLVPANVNSSGPKRGMLLMQPNSSAMMCVKYVKPSGWNSSIDVNNTKLDHPLLVQVEDIHVSGNLLSFDRITVNNVVISKILPSTISFGSQKNASTVILYTVTAKSDSKGYYHLPVPYMCGDVLLAVGYNASNVDSSAFQDVNPMCFNFGVDVSIVGISGANMVYVNTPPEKIHSTKLDENISIIPPLQQVRLYSYNEKSILCNQGFQLVFKSEGGSPACVKPDSAIRLIALGWAVENIHQSHGVEPFDTLKMNVRNTDLSFNYTILGGQLENATVNMQNKSIDLLLNTTKNGTLIVILPRGLINPQMHGQDSPFIIIEDGKEIKYKQLDSTITDRTLIIPFQHGVSKLEIISPESIR
ncbi:hypothetical protein DYY66_1682 [Candidatus Nitrosotalea sp. FS]|uniref:hypothetical protein n=1 Tax=Candidatus Nitrosotalea sp. FS TaxID=2341021 RepID=UPI00140DDC6C|nr:hypothetical protein [Candidatus Nitrosotalea sp. FS]NHH97181.1 hypothetical protein [Candidatus Nitrosotalea sp. FS]